MLHLDIAYIVPATVPLGTPLGTPMPSRTLIVTAKQALLPDSDEPRPATLTIDKESGKIVAVHNGVNKALARASDEQLHVPDDLILLPGLIDCHVHLNEPGRTAWEGFQTGTTAAVSGGVTTLIDMPLNSIPPTTTVAHLETKRAAARKVGVHANVGFWGGIVPGNAKHLRPLIDAGVKGFKCFLMASGVDEFPPVDEDDLIRACDALEGTNALILFHDELVPDTLAGLHKDNSLYSSFLASRPPAFELAALDLIISLARRYPHLRFHIVHLSTAKALPIIRHARRSGVANLTVETCFHYLTLRAEDIPPDATQFKCCPPVREETNRLQLVEAVIDGTIDYIVSDHSPCIAELKRGDFMTAWGGISCLGLGLPLLWTEFGNRMGIGGIVQAMASRQARQLGLEERKGALRVGCDADFVVFEPETEFEVTLETLRFKNKISPYIGRTLRGLVKQTYLRGQQAWDSEAGAESPLGTLL